MLSSFYDWVRMPCPATHKEVKHSGKEGAVLILCKKQIQLISPLASCLFCVCTQKHKALKGGVNSIGFWVQI